MFVIIYLHFHGTSLANLRTDRIWTRAGRLFKKILEKDAEDLSQGGNSGDDRKWLALEWVWAEISILLTLDVEGMKERSPKKTPRFWSHSWRSRVSPMWNRDS